MQSLSVNPPAVQVPAGHEAQQLLPVLEQLLRSATSVGANYRAACRAKSPDDFIAKMKIVEEEADECLYWLELLAESGLVAPERLTEVVAEGNALVAMTVASIKTLRWRTIQNRKSKI